MHTPKKIYLLLFFVIIMYLVSTINDYNFGSVYKLEAIDGNDSINQVDSIYST